MEEKAHAEPPKLEAPRINEIGVQVDPPPQNVGTQMTPPSSSPRRTHTQQNGFYGAHKH